MTWFGFGSKNGSHCNTVNAQLMTTTPNLWLNYQKLTGGIWNYCCSFFICTNVGFTGWL